LQRFSHAIIERMTLPAYPAARFVAPKVHDYFTRQHADAQTAEMATLPRGVPPDSLTIEAMINAAFWASLRREEGYVPKISLAYVSPDDAGQPLIFARPLSLDPAPLTRVAPAVERAGIHLGVWPSDPAAGGGGGELKVWGTTQRIPSLCFVLEVAAPGLLVIKHHRGDESGKYVNVAVLEGDQVKLVDERASIQPDCPALLTSLLGFDGPTSEVDSANVLVELAVSMRAHGRGGSLLVVPSAHEAWRESIVNPIPYAVVPAYDELAHVARRRADDRHETDRHEADRHEAGEHGGPDAFDEVVSAIAGLTAVDGATVLTTRLELVGFGATIVRRKGWAQVEQVLITEPIEGGAAALVHPEQIGGTRHRSAAQFAHDQRDAMALVASHDGNFTVFAWSPHESLVRAHRIETLLL
jgi:hypothetical protein